MVAEAMHAVISHRSSGRPLTVEGGDRPRRRRARHGQGPLARRVRGRAPGHPLDLGLRHRRGAHRGRRRQGRARRDRDVQQRRASSRSTRGSARSCAARRWPSTSRSSPASRASTRSASCPSSACDARAGLARRRGVAGRARAGRRPRRRRPGHRRAARRGARALPRRVPPRRAQRLDHAAARGRGVRRGVAALADPRARRRGPLDGERRADRPTSTARWTATSPSRR